MMKIVLKFIILFCLTQHSISLFEDQIGKFDWRQKFLGKTKSAELCSDSTSRSYKRLFVTTEENVLASINTKNGEIVWRQIMDKDSTLENLLLRTNDVLVVSGGKKSILYSFDHSSGSLQWQWPFTTECNKSIHLINGADTFAVVASCEKISAIDNAGETLWTLTLSNDDDMELIGFSFEPLNHQLFAIGHKQNQFFRYNINAKTGRLVEHKSISGSHFFDKCFQLNNATICVDFSKSSIFSLVSNDVGQNLEPVLIHTVQNGILNAVPAAEQYLIVVDSEKRGQVYFFNENNFLPIFKNQIQQVMDFTWTSSEEDVFVIFASKDNDNNRLVQWYNVKDGQEIETNRFQIAHSQETYGISKIYAVSFEEENESDRSYRVVLVGEDYSIAAYQGSNKPLWVRQEVLSQIVAVEMMDLPLSESQASVESEFSTEGESLASMFTKRLTTQAKQIQRAFLRMLNETFVILGALGSTASPADWLLIVKGGLPSLRTHSEALRQDSDAPHFERDYFNLHKVIVVVTSIGKVFGLDNRQGKILWQFYEHDLAPFFADNKPSFSLFILRTTAHFPHPALCGIFGRHKKTQNGFLITFDPISGKIKESVEMNVPVKQVMLLPVETDNESYGLALLDVNDHAYIFPKTISQAFSKSLKTTPYFVFNVDRNTGSAQGYRFLDHEPQNSKVHNTVLQSWPVEKMWNVVLPVEKRGKILDLKMKRFNEHVHSQGRVLGDRSVLYKYSNPNLVAATIEKVEDDGKTSLLVYLFDAVTGSVISSLVHRRVSKPFHLVHCENWLVYSYFSEKARRTEITVLELYEGKHQTDPDKFSSFTARPSPIVMRQSYIFPQGISAMAVTDTEKGITSRHLLISLPFGGLLELHKAFLDPRRVLNPTQEEREEGLLAYVPDLPIATEYLINYNMSIFNIRGIHTAQAGLESTSLVLAYGLDLFYTRVNPSATFDILKDDFDHWFISLMLLGLFLASVITKRLAKIRDLKLAWK